MRLERAIKFLGFRTTPYVNGEAFYDTNGDRWNRFEALTGFEVPWGQTVVLDFYYAHQEVYQAPDSETIGFAIEKHMLMPLGEK